MSDVPPLRIAFFGLPLAAILLAADGHAIELAALSRTDAPGRRRLSRTIGADRVVARGEVGEADLVRRVVGLAPDLVVSWFWTRRLPMQLVGAARLGGIGAHPSLLPRHRGADPYFAAIDAGDTVTGVTVHRIAAEYDTGAILATRRLAIDSRWNAWQLARALDRPSLALLREVVGRFARGEPISESPQDETLATRADAPSEEDCALRWDWPAERIVRRIRALAPVPGAFTEIGGAIVVVTEAHATERFPRVLVPGEAAVVDGRVVVRAGDGAVTLDAGQIDDEPADAETLARLVDRARRTLIG
jgi:methionyl-tRNA formyltransferase